MRGTPPTRATALTYAAFTPAHLPSAQDTVEVGSSLLVVGFPEVQSFFRRRRARRRAAWSTRTMARLERIGRRAGRARRPFETPREYANVLAAYLHDERIAEVGETLDADGFSDAGASPSARASADSVLSSL